MRSLDVNIELNRFSELRRRLIEIDPEIDERTLCDSLEGATNLKEAIAGVVRSVLDDEALVNGLKLRLEAMKGRLERIQATAAKKRELALAAMEEADIEKNPRTRFYSLHQSCTPKRSHRR